MHCRIMTVTGGNEEAAQMKGWLILAEMRENFFVCIIKLGKSVQFIMSKLALLLFHLNLYHPK